MLEVYKNFLSEIKYGMTEEIMVYKLKTFFENNFNEYSDFNYNEYLLIAEFISFKKATNENYSLENLVDNLKKILKKYNEGYSLEESINYFLTEEEGRLK